jgi:hypothetical protein
MVEIAELHLVFAPNRDRADQVVHRIAIHRDTADERIADLSLDQQLGGHDLLGAERGVRQAVGIRVKSLEVVRAPEGAAP